MKYLTKSRFKIGMSCPTKLYFESNSSQFDNNDDGNEFMKALAKGGIQVGEMARLYYPNGIEIDGRNKEEQLAQTNTALQQKNVIIYEAAIKVGHKFIRIDILEKKEDVIKIFEVKSASCDGPDESQFTTGRTLKRRKYLEDIAFQYLVCLDFFKEFKVIPYLMMPDKNIESSIDDLYQKFVLVKVGDRDKCKVVKGTQSDDLGEQIMTAVRVSNTIEYLINDTYYIDHLDFGGRGFKEVVKWFEELLLGYEDNSPCYFSKPFVKCRDCEYRSTETNKSGFHQCMIKKNNWSTSDFERPKVWDVWYSPKLKDFLNEGKWFMDEISSTGLNNGARFDRQSLQIERTNSKIKEAYIDKEGLRSEIDNFDWPLNLVDFETTGPAIPFFKSYKPYQGLCFQFSHHVLHKDGRVEHKNEYLGMGQGANPSFRFIERLYESLSENQGSVFMFSFHENTYLNYMMKLLWKESPFNEDYTNKLIKFLQSLTKPSKDSTVHWEPTRKMIDIAVMVRAYYWHPEMKGSNSIKDVLPAIMNDSDFIKDKYSNPIYGKNCEVKSLNFDKKVWVEFDDDSRVKDPYKTLPTLDELLPMNMQTIERLFSNNKVGDGGAAMTSWAFMQFAEMKEEERNNIAKALKMYCELDTMAMVMIMEAWIDMILTEKAEKKK
jgi:hypothetical protein